MTGVRPRLVSAAYAGGWLLVQRLPEPTGRRLFRLGADLATRRAGKPVRRLRANYARVTARPAGELDALVQAGMRSYARYWYEVFRLPTMSPEEVQSRVETEHRQRIWDGVKLGRGVVMALPHQANWDLGAAWLTGCGVRFTTVAERLEPAGLFDRFVAFREGLGMEVIALTGGERPPFAVLAERLRAGHVLCLVADRDLSAAGVPVRFFGARATMPAGPAALALETGAVLLPATLDYASAEDNPWGCRVHIGQPLEHSDVATMTQQLADIFEESIRLRPQDWHMLQRLWSDDLAPRSGHR